MSIPETLTMPKNFNITSYFLDRNITEGRGNKTALICGDKKYTYFEIQQRTNQMGNILLELGVEMEDRVLLVLNDSIDFVASWFGIMKIGAVATDVYTYLKAADYEYYLNYTRAKIVIVDPATYSIVAEAAKNAPLLKYMLVAGDPPTSLNTNEYTLEDLLVKASPELEATPTIGDEFALWKFTTGSTGKPKGTVHTHHNTLYNFHYYGLKVLGYTSDDLVIPVPKLFFGYARDAALVYPFGVGGGAVIFPERTTAERLFQLIEAHKPTAMIQVPTMMNAMALHPDAEKYDLSSLRFCTSAGEALPYEVYRRWKDKFDVEVLDGIGSAELYHIYLSNTLDHVVPGSLGRVIEGYEGKILGADGEPVEQGEPGVLHMRGGSAGVMYWNDRQKSVATFAGEWVNTGDLFRQDEEGNYYFCGRADDLIKVSGIWVSPQEIEDCLLEHPQIKEVAVIPYEEIKGLILPAAFIVLKDNEAKMEDSECIAYVKSKLAPYKAPRKVVFLEELPKTAQGKINKKVIKESRWD